MREAERGGNRRYPLAEGNLGYVALHTPVVNGSRNTAVIQ